MGIIQLCFHLVAVLLCFQLRPVSPDETNHVFADQYLDQGCEGQRYDAFDWNLLKSLNTPDSGNVLLSPFSLKMVLAMLYEGSSGSTEIELKRVLDFPPNKQDTKKKFLKIIQSLGTGSADQTLDIGSRVYMDTSLKAQQRFRAALKTFYRTDLKYVDFYNSEATKEEINYWVSNVTHGKLTELVQQGDLQGARLVLANAIYYKGQWRKPFPRENTTMGVFYTANQGPVEVPFMRLEAHMYYSDSIDLDAKILRLPFQGGHIAMFILLPNSRNGLNNLIRKLNPEALRQEICIMDDQQTVHVLLPRFSFQFNAKLKEILRTLGLKHMFESTASLAGIARGQEAVANLMVSNIMQKSGIEVNEEGSTVYAATEAILADRISGIKDVNFTVSHPFLFYIEDEFTGNVLFAGKVENPLETEL